MTEPTRVANAPAGGTLPAGVAYRLWAERYDEETVVSALDERAARRFTPSLAGTSLLDVGCGTGRRLPRVRDGGPTRVVGIDLVHEMLAAGRERRGPRTVAVGDVLALPVADASFDVVWCRLVLGHLRALERAYAELARTARPGARVFCTDFHPEATDAGHTRTFRDVTGRLHAIEHFVHRAEDHEHAAAAAGLTRIGRMDLAVGPSVKHFYARAGALDRYEHQVGLHVVLALHFEQ